MSAYIGLDVGNKMVGVALCDLHGKFATPHATYPRAGGKAERELLKLISERRISTLVVGLPLTEGGERTEQCGRIEQFCNRVQKRSTVGVVYIDEHLTTFEAEEQLRLAGLNHRNNKKNGVIDQLSATIILQDYLNSKSIEPESR